MLYNVTRKEVNTGRIFKTECTEEQINNIVKYPISLYQLESIEPIQENTENINTNVEPKQTIIIESKKAGRPKTVNTVKELNSIIKRGKREILDYINNEVDRTFIYNMYELIKEDCKKYSDCNKTTKQMYFNFLQWWNKYDKILYPEYHTII